MQIYHKIEHFLSKSESSSSFSGNPAREIIQISILHFKSRAVQLLCANGYEHIPKTGYERIHCKKGSPTH